MSKGRVVETLITTSLKPWSTLDFTLIMMEKLHGNSERGAPKSPLGSERIPLTALKTSDYRNTRMSEKRRLDQA